jgi:hypothetical protein
MQDGILQHLHAVERSTAIWQHCDMREYSLLLTTKEGLEKRVVEQPVEGLMFII